MKRVFILLLSILAIGLQAQSGFSFQASFKEKDGKPAANKKIPLRFTIQDPAAKAIYTEDQTATTDQFGLVSLIIGNGSAFSKIDWSKGSFTLKVDCDADNNGTFEQLSSGPLLSGPFVTNTSSGDSIVGSKFIQVITKKGNGNQDIVELYLKETIFDELTSRKFLRCDSVFVRDTTPKGVVFVFDKIKCDSIKLFDDSKIIDLVKSRIDESKETIFEELPRRKFIRCDSVFVDTILKGVMTRIFIRIKCDSVRLFDESLFEDLLVASINPIKDSVNSLKNRVNKIEGKSYIPLPVNPQNGQVIKWNGAAWIADEDLSSVGSGSAATSGALKGDGSAANPITLKEGSKLNEVLAWNGNAWQGIIIQEDNDRDTTNEIQAISLLGNNTTIQLSKNGGQIDLPKNVPQWNANYLFNNPVSGNTPEVGEVLKWNGNKWEPSKDSSSNASNAITLSDLIDVTIPNPQTGQVLKFNGNKWQADTDLSSVGSGNAATTSPLQGNGSSGSPITLAPVTGTSIPQVLKWSNGTWAPAPETAGPQGPKGDQGIQGIQGIKGDQGLQGIQGPAGSYTAGTGISIANSTIINTGDTDPANDITTTSNAGGDVSGVYTNLQLVPNAVGITELADNTVGTSKIANNAVTFNKLAPGTPNTPQVLKWNGGSWAPGTESAGSVYTAGPGIAILNNVISNIGDQSSTNEIQTLSYNSSANQLNLSNGGGAVTLPYLLPTTNFGGDVSGPSTNLQIAANAVGNTEMADNAINTAELANNAVTNSKIADNAVGTQKINDGAVGLVDLALPTGKDLIANTHLIWNGSAWGYDQITIENHISASNAAVSPKGGNLPLGTTSSRWGTLYTTTNPNVASDRKLKKDIGILAYGLNEVLKMKPIDYHLLTEKNSQKKHLGFIAQEMEILVPEVVEKQITDGKEMYGLKYSELVPVLVKAIQEQQQMIESLKSEMAEIKAQRVNDTKPGVQQASLNKK